MTVMIMMMRTRPLWLFLHHPFAILPLPGLINARADDITMAEVRRKTLEGERIRRTRRWRRRPALMEMSLCWEEGNA